MEKNVNYFLKKLLTNFPVFINTMKPDDIQPFILFGDLGIYLRDQLDSGNYNFNEIEEIFGFLNEMGMSNDEEVHNLLTVGVLEVLIDSKTGYELAKRKLKDEAFNNLEQIYNYWYKK